MNSPGPVRAAALGMACPLGLRLRPALAAIHAGISPFFDHETFVGPGGPARVAMLDDPRVPTTRHGRAAFFLRHAVAESLASLAAADDLAQRPLACILALPQPGLGPQLDPAALMRELEGLTLASGLPAKLRLHGAVTEGRAGIFAALETALALLTLGREPLILLAGVDSLVDDETLHALADRNLLMGRSNFDGVFPGEGAGCVVLTVDPRQRPLAYLLANAVAREPEPFVDVAATGKISGAQGLAAVFAS
ncbi:MAG: hypothetical protein KC431_19450, partial [Myxococcales bacterium]|nr:hypothetical protein [Myxococcales bacterium]